MSGAPRGKEPSAERAAFEAEYRKLLRAPHLQQFTVNSDGDYASAIVFSAWRMWQARANFAAPVSAAQNSSSRLIPDSECKQGKCACTTTGCWRVCSLRRECADTSVAVAWKPSKTQVIEMATANGIDVDTDGDIWGSTNGALLKFADALLAAPDSPKPSAGSQAAPDAKAALLKLLDRLDRERRRARHTPGTGQHHAYLDADEVAAHVEEARKTLAAAQSQPAPEAKGDSKSMVLDKDCAIGRCRRHAIGCYGTCAAAQSQAAPDAKAENASLRNWLNIARDNGLSLGDRLQRISSSIQSLMAGDAPDKYPPHTIREQCNCASPQADEKE